MYGCKLALVALTPAALTVVATVPVGVPPDVAPVVPVAVAYQQGVEFPDWG